LAQAVNRAESRQPPAGKHMNMSLRPSQLVLVTAGALGCLTGSPAAQEPARPPADHLQHHFDPARDAQRFDDPSREAWQLPDRVIAALGLRPDASVADIGAGTGYFTVRLARVVPKGMVYAVDIEPRMLDHIRTRAAAANLANVATVQAAPGGPNLPKPVDVVLVVDTYHHLPDRPAYFAGLRKALAPGARVAIVDFRKSSPEGPPPEFRFEPQQINDEMGRAGYDLDATHDFLPRQYFLVFRPKG
jgi:SAM-dependent methyltransferase